MSDRRRFFIVKALEKQKDTEEKIMKVCHEYLKTGEKVIYIDSKKIGARVPKKTFKS